MSPFQFPFAFIAFLGFVMVLPPWMWFLENYSGGLAAHNQFIAGLILPAALSLFVASWVDGS